MNQTKKCTGCQKTLPTEAYSKRKDTGNLRSQCKTCVSQGNLKRYHEKGKESQAIRARKNALKKYGLTVDDYDAMLAAQEERCKICGVHQSDASWGRLVVDHCHDTGKVRGLLCNNCNSGIGKLKDSVDLLEKAIGYLNESTST